MFIITIIPISRGIGKDTLTYFTAEKVALGSLVSVPIRGKKSHGLVIEIKEASEAKMELKNLSYAMKKIDKVQQQAFLSPTFVEAAKNIADYYAATVGSVLAQLVPKAILDAPVPTLSSVEHSVAEIATTSEQDALNAPAISATGRSTSADQTPSRVLIVARSPFTLLTS